MIFIVSEYMKLIKINVIRVLLLERKRTIIKSYGKSIAFHNNHATNWLNI